MFLLFVCLVQIEQEEVVALGRGEFQPWVSSLIDEAREPSPLCVDDLML